MAQHIPIGLLDTHDLATRFPERKEEIFRNALDTRECDLITLRESRHLVSWHPFRIAKTILFAGLLAFSVTYSVSEIGALGKFYVQARTSNISIAIPVIGDQHLNIGAYVPSSTALALASQIPSYGLNESLAVAVAVMLSILIERIIVSIIQWKKIKKLREAEEGLIADLATLNEWIGERKT